MGEGRIGEGGRVAGYVNKDLKMYTKDGKSRDRHRYYSILFLF